MQLNLFIKNIGVFIFLVLFQALLLNNIQITPLGITPYMYVLFLLIIPFDTPRWLLLISAFLLGLSVDIFSDTLGSHASACLFMAFLRPIMLQTISPRDGYESGIQPKIHYLGLNWFVRYAIILIFFHHFWFFIIDAFRFSQFFYTLVKIALSTLLSTILIIISQYFIFRK